MPVVGKCYVLLTTENSEKRTKNARKNRSQRCHPEPFDKSSGQALSKGASDCIALRSLSHRSAAVRSVR
ncbi:hypothetical protein BH09BAC1_BH09BAC1_16810 [soil metagenome]